MFIFFLLLFWPWCIYAPCFTRTGCPWWPQLHSSSVKCHNRESCDIFNLRQRIPIQVQLWSNSNGARRLFDHETGPSCGMSENVPVKFSSISPTRFVAKKSMHCGFFQIKIENSIFNSIPQKLQMILNRMATILHDIRTCNGFRDAGGFKL